MPAMSEEEFNRVLDRFELRPNTELIWTLLETHKYVEEWSTREPLAEKLGMIEGMLIATLARRFDKESAERAFAIALGDTDDELRFPDFGSLEGEEAA